MKNFNLQSFQQSHPVLLKAIIKSMETVYDSQQEVLNNAIKSFEKLKKDSMELFNAYEARIKELETQLNETLPTETEAIHPGE
jgi:F0F1-type ATP synthase membrane subunit b/b'